MQPCVVAAGPTLASLAVAGPGRPLSRTQVYFACNVAARPWSCRILRTLATAGPRFAAIKRRLLLALRGVGLPLHEVPSSGCAYPRRGAMAGYFYGHPDPVLPVYWLGAEMVPAVRRALAR